MAKNKFNFILRPCKTNYNFLLHQNVVAFQFLRSVFFQNSFVFSRIVFYNTSSFVLICFSFKKPIGVKKIESVFYFLEKHLQFSVFNKVPVIIFSKSLKQVKNELSSFSFSLVLKKSLENCKDFDSIFFDLYLLLKSHYTITSSSLKGVLVQFKGRLGGSDRSKKKIIVFGKSSKAFTYSKIDFSCTSAFTRFGVFSIKVWVFFNLIINMIFNQIKKRRFSPFFIVSCKKKIVFDFETVAMSKVIKKQHGLFQKYFCIVFFNHFTTTKGSGVRIGKGKGSHQFFAYNVFIGSIIYT